MIRCEICESQGIIREFKNTQGLRGHMTFIHGKTGSTKILSAPAAIEQRLSELEQLLGITASSIEQTTEQPVSRLRARLGLTDSKTEPITEQLSNIKNKLNKLEGITGLKEDSSLDRLLGTDKPLTEQPLDHTRQFTQLRKQIAELTNQLNSSNISNTELTKQNEQATVVTHKLDELKASHNRLREGYEKLIPWLHKLEDKLNSVDGLKESVNGGLGKLEREVGDLRSKLQPLTVLPSKVETVKSDVTRLADRVAIAERRAKQQPTGYTERLRLTDGREHTFRVFKSPDGLAKPHVVAHDLLLGNKYVDLTEPLD